MRVPTPTVSESVSSGYAPGYVISDKYELEAVLGEGGMGAVWRARNTAIDLPVAIKLIRAGLNRDALAGRLLQEARAAAKLSHPAIVRVFDVGQTEHGDPFIVMELLQGQSLADRLQEGGRLAATHAVQLLLPIADALALAHSKGLVHRDVKPDNVFVVMDEHHVQPKLVDFGIVKLEQRDGGSQLTQVGAVMGSPEYMSPEQARGRDDLDLRTDVWSFSVMLYEAVTGVTPFTSPNYNALLRMIVEEEAPSLRQLAAADDALSEILAQGMSKEPSARWQSMGQMGKALAHWLLDQGISVDCCGVSLETKWLMRSTDPRASSPGPTSRPSIPDSWPEPRSGVRSVGQGFASAATVVAKESVTPVSVPPETDERPQLRTRRVYVGVAALVAVAAVAFAWARSPDATRLPSAALPAVAAAPQATEAKSIEAVVAPDASLAPAESAAAPNPAVKSPPVRAKARSKAAPARVKPSAAQPATDLLAPY